MTHLPWPSITRAPRGTLVVAAGPTALMRLPAMITVLSDELAAAPSSSGCTTVAPTMTVTRGPASDVAAAAPQSAAASTIRQQQNRDMAVGISTLRLSASRAPRRQSTQAALERLGNRQSRRRPHFA